MAKKNAIDKLDAAIAGCEAMEAEATTPENLAAAATVEVPAAVEAATAEAMNRRAAYEAIVEANRNSRNDTRQSRFYAVKELMEEGKSMPQIAVALDLTYRQVKHAAWYVQHPEVPMPTR